jgi:hypothetical protein
LVFILNFKGGFEKRVEGRDVWCGKKKKAGSDAI